MNHDLLRVLPRAVGRLADSLGSRRPAAPRAGPDDFPAVAVHGLALGGSGKTPLCAWLAMRLVERGHEPLAVATRGPSRVADETAWFRLRLPGTTVIAHDDPSRAVGAARRAGCRLVVLDDPSLSRPAPAHLRILCLAPGDGWDVPAFPGGGRRPGSLRRDEVDRLVLLDGADPPPPFPRSDSDRALTRPLGFVPLARSGDEPRRTAPFARAFLLCGVARPGRVGFSLGALGVHPVGRWALPDHVAWPAFVRTAAERWALLRGADAVVITEKDAARLPPGFSGSRVPWWVFRTTLEIEASGETLLAEVERALTLPRIPADRSGVASPPPRQEGPP